MISHSTWNKNLITIHQIQHNCFLTTSQISFIRAMMFFSDKPILAQEFCTYWLFWTTWLCHLIFSCLIRLFLFSSGSSQNIISSKRSSLKILPASQLNYYQIILLYFLHGSQHYLMLSNSLVFLLLLLSLLPSASPTSATPE